MNNYTQFSSTQLKISYSNNCAVVEVQKTLSKELSSQFQSFWSPQLPIVLMLGHLDKTKLQSYPLFVTHNIKNFQFFFDKYVIKGQIERSVCIITFTFLFIHQ